MPKKGVKPDARVVELLEKLLLVELQPRGLPQGKIARFLGRQTAWVNANLKCLRTRKKKEE